MATLLLMDLTNPSWVSAIDTRPPRPNPVPTHCAAQPISPCGSSSTE